jgi:hypothetical protein
LTIEFNLFQVLLIYIFSSIVAKLRSITEAIAWI